MNAYVKFTDEGDPLVSPVSEQKLNNTIHYMFKEEKIDYSKIDHIDFCPDLFMANPGDSGYYVIPHGREGVWDDCLCYFKNRENVEVEVEGPVMPMFGVIRNGENYLVIVNGMPWSYRLVISVHDGIYRIFPRFYLGGDIPYESISMLTQKLSSDADYNTVALLYRDYQIRNDNIIPIKEREKNSSVLLEAVKSPFIRIRMGWKPVPPSVMEQTIENEPSMHVACTFDDVEKLVEDCHAAGVRHAEFCLVGWNIRGHDGRWPQIFPVEPALGGEEKLRELIKKAKGYGYLIVSHLNSTDAYSIADCFDKDDLAKDKHGSVIKDTPWSGGQMYKLCSEVAEKQAEVNLKRVADLGFRGLQYIDVISTIPPRKCYDHNHPQNEKQCVENWRKIMRLAKKQFGGFSSEGTYDFAGTDLDYGLYSSFGDKGSPIYDEPVPLWQIVYHGYVMSNPFTVTVNPNDEQILKLAEYGGRPAIYFYQKFVTENSDRGNWMGEEDLACHTEEERKNSVREIVRICNEYEKYSDLQECFIISHHKKSEGVYKIKYSNGDEIIVDYNKKEWKRQEAERRNV